MSTDRPTVLGRMLDAGLVPIITARDLDTARALVAACADGGAPVVELTNRGAGAWERFSRILEWCGREYPHLALGAGTVVEPATAALYINAGASFIVAPSLNADVVRVCNRRKVACIPGCSTLTEIGQAEELGCELIKLFPVDSLGGPAFVKAILAPCPWTSLLAMGGLDATRASLEPYFAAGVRCVGMGSKLMPPDAVKRGDFKSVARRVKSALGVIRSIRPRG